MSRFVLLIPLIPAIALGVRRLTLPVGRALQNSYGLSDQAVTEMSIAVPVILTLGAYAAVLAWLMW